MTLSASALLPFQLTIAKLEATRLGHSSLLDWLYALGTLLGVWVVTRTVHALVQSRLKKTAHRTLTPFDDVAHEVARGTYWYFHAALALLVAQRFVNVGPTAEPLVHGLIVLCLFAQVGVWAQRTVSGLVRVWAQQNEGGHNATMAAGVRFVSRLVIWSIVGLLVLAHWGVHIEAVMAGLGVGGIAAALALQGILGDLFAGLSMYFDRPFDIGDSIAVDPLRGTVLKIGLRTTRIISLDGEEIIIPNGDLVKSRIKNFARMKERRVVFAFGLEYGLLPDKIEQACDIVREVLGREELVQVDRGHFKGFGPSALECEFVYRVLSNDYPIYMDIQQRVSLAIYREFSKHGIWFAFPTQTLHVANPDAVSGLRRAGAGAHAADPAGSGSAEETRPPAG